MCSLDIHNAIPLDGIHSHTIIRPDFSKPSSVIIPSFNHTRALILYTRLPVKIYPFSRLAPKYLNSHNRTAHSAQHFYQIYIPLTPTQRFFLLIYYHFTLTRQFFAHLLPLYPTRDSFLPICYRLNQRATQRFFALKQHFVQSFQVKICSKSVKSAQFTVISAKIQ